jgi:hypothetical protein
MQVSTGVPCHGECLAWLIDALPPQLAGDDVVAAARGLLHGWPEAYPGQVEALRRGMGRDPSLDAQRPSTWTTRKESRR